MSLSTKILLVNLAAIKLIQGYYQEKGFPKKHLNLRPGEAVVEWILNDKGQPITHYHMLKNGPIFWPEIHPIKDVIPK